jgi:beta-phosphoglucomutase-like phosphatase (HAD superfamily)
VVKAVLCDIDGTLVESNWLHAAAWRDAFAVADIVVDLEDARRQIGKGGDELIPVFVPWWKRKAIEEPLKAYRQFIFRKDYLHQVKPFPKVRELLERMKEKRNSNISRLFSTQKRARCLQKDRQYRRSCRGKQFGRRCEAIQAPSRYLRSDSEETWLVTQRGAGTRGHTL